MTPNTRAVIFWFGLLLYVSSFFLAAFVDFNGSAPGWKAAGLTEVFALVLIRDLVRGAPITQRGSYPSSRRFGFQSTTTRQTPLGLYSCCCIDAHFACSCETSDSILSASKAWGSAAFA